MSIKGLDAANAYAAAAARGGSGMSAKEALSGGSGFADMLKEVTAGVAEATDKSEKASIAGLNRQMDLVDVVSEVSNAEMMVNTVVAVRDRVIQAYQEIMRMPI